MCSWSRRNLNPREDQERAEHVDDEVQRPEKDPRGRNQHRPHHQRPDDAPEQHPVLVRGWHRERREDEQEDEDVVDAQRLLDEVAGRPFNAGLGALERVHADVEDDGKANPGDAPGERLLSGHLVRVAVEDAQVEREHARDERQENSPGKEFDEQVKIRVSRRRSR